MSRKTRRVKLAKAGGVKGWRCPHDNHLNPPGQRMCKVCNRRGPRQAVQ